jgi:hypothetical protein
MYIKLPRKNTLMEKARFHKKAKKKLTDKQKSDDGREKIRIGIAPKKETFSERAWRNTNFHSLHLSIIFHHISMIPLFALVAVFHLPFTSF